MKKIFISLALVLFCVAQVGAQQKDAQAVLKALDKAKAGTEKKADKADSWMKLGSAYAACYDAPTNGLWADAPQVQVKLILKDQRIVSSEKKEIGGVNYQVDTYEDKVLYYDEAGKLQAWTVTKPIMEGDILQMTADAYKKAESLSAPEKDLKTAFSMLARKYWDRAMSGYRLGNYKDAAVNFEKSFAVSSDPAVGMIDTVALYYGAITATMAKDNASAIKLLEKCLSYKYDQKGEVYAYMADAYKQMKDTVKAKEVLSMGYEKYPASQSILVALINTYLETNDDPEKVLSVIHKAQQNEPTNASLFYAEGNLQKKLKNFDKAIVSFEQAAKVDPKYVFAPFAEGDTYYQMGLAIQDKASLETDDAKYNELNDQLNQCLEKAIVPFEKAFNIAEDKEIKRACAEYLKNIYFRFRDKNEEYKTAYDKYNSYLDNN